MFFSRSRAAVARHRPARVPDGMRVYAVGDIHGRHDLLLALLKAIEADAAPSGMERRIVFLGDYIDRGEASAAVVELLAAGAATGSWTCLTGNHEAMLLATLAGALDWDIWLANGGAETLFSYGVSARDFIGPEKGEALRAAALAAIPAAHLAFLRGLPGHLEIGDYFFCHAGVRPGVPLDRQSLDDLIWIRDAFTLSSLDHGKRIVHGHTPAMQVEVLPNRINVDTGAYLTNCLSCVVLEGEEVRVIHT